MITYKLHKDPYSDNIGCIIRNTDGEIANIPLDPDNRDYREYLKWLEEGNEPLPADEGNV